jgi:hypothetical protein
MNEGKLVLRHTPLGVIPHLREHLLHVGEAKLVCRISIGFFAGERCRDNALSILGWNFLGWSGVDLGGRSRGKAPHDASAQNRCLLDGLKLHARAVH